MPFFQQAKVLIFSFLIAFLLTLSSAQNPTSERNLASSFDFSHCSYDYDCYTETLKLGLTNSGIKPTLANLRGLSASNQTVQSYCHSIVHELGRAAYEQTQGDIGKVFTEGDTTCWSGFYHGALERAFSHSKDLAKTAQSLCTAENGVNGSFLYYQCLHGLGHGLSVRFDNEIYQALAICERLVDGYQQKSCYGGVFMENYVANPAAGHVSKYLNSDDPIAPCNKVAEKFKYNCYQLVSIQILKLNGYDFGKAFTTCEQADSRYMKVCYQSVGRDISGYTAENPDKALEYCYLGSKTAQKECIRAIAADSVYSKSSEDYVVEICKKVKEVLKPDCYESAGSSIAVLYDEVSKRQTACAKMEGDYISSCKRAAGV